MGKVGRSRKVFMLAALLGAAFAFPRLVLAAEQRVALVIGNSAYPSAPLRNPVNDAKAMAEKLQALGFEVLLRTNVNQRDINRAVVQFGQKLSAGSVGLFYYAGHGLQVRGKNFLIPVDAEIENEASIRGEAIDVDLVLDQFGSSRLSMVILDACRNNPFERRFRASAGAGLAQIDAPKGTLIAYSTAPGKTAADGLGNNGIYTEQLLRTLDTPGLKVEDVFKQVRINVARATQDQQIPWEASSLTGEFFFRPPIEKPVLAAPVAAPAPVMQRVDPVTVELAFWDSIKTSTNRADFEAYLDQYPQGRFAALARNRIKNTEQQMPIAAVRTPVPATAEPAARVETESKARTEPSAATPRPAAVGEIVALAAPSSLPKPSTSSRPLKIGDSWTYQLKDLRYNKTLPAITFEITGGDANGIQEILRIVSTAQPDVSRNPSAESRVFEKQSPTQQRGINRLLSLEPRIFEHSLSGDVTLFEFAPFLTHYSELAAGAVWPSVPGAINTSGESQNIDWRFSGKVVGRERVSVPAGNFDAIKVELTGTLDLGPSSRTMGTGGDFVVSSQDYAAWFAPEVGRLVKYTRKTYNRRRTPVDDELFELVRFKLN